MPHPALTRALRFGREVFPPGLHVAYVLAWLGALLGALASFARGGGRAEPIAMWRAAGAAVTMFLLLFFLRVADEVKDLEYDRRMNPGRPLVRGVVGAGDVRRILAVTALIVIGLNALMGPGLLAIAAADVAYGLLLVGLERASRAIRDGMLLNLALTYPVNIAISVYVYALFLGETGVAPNARGALTVAAFVLAFLHYELSRKIAWPAFAREGERLYSGTFLGVRGATALALACALLACGLVVALALSSGAGAPRAASGLLPLAALAPPARAIVRFLRAPGERRSLKGAGTLFLFLFYVLLVLEALLRRDLALRL